MNNSKLPEHLVNKLANGQQITITVEYSCLQKGEAYRGDMKILRRWHDEGIVELKGTETMTIEFEKANPNVRAKLEEQFLGLDKLRPKYGAKLGRLILGRSALGTSGTLRNGKDAYDYLPEFQQIMFPEGNGSENDFHDVWHISIHYLFEQDVFMTGNLKHFRVDKLRQKFNDLVILTPSECVDLIKNNLNIFGKKMRG